jgi:hypothetical protein
MARGAGQPGIAPQRAPVPARGTGTLRNARRHPAADPSPLGEPLRGGGAAPRSDPAYVMGDASLVWLWMPSGHVVSPTMPKQTVAERRLASCLPRRPRDDAGAIEARNKLLPALGEMRPRRRRRPTAAPHRKTSRDRGSRRRSRTAPSPWRGAGGRALVRRPREAGESPEMCSGRVVGTWSAPRMQRAYHRRSGRIFRVSANDPGAIGSIQAIVAIAPVGVSKVAESLRRRARGGTPGRASSRAPFSHCHWRRLPLARRT